MCFLELASCGKVVPGARCSSSFAAKSLIEIGLVKWLGFLPQLGSHLQKNFHVINRVLQDIGELHQSKSHFLRG